MANETLSPQITALETSLRAIGMSVGTVDGVSDAPLQAGILQTLTDMRRLLTDNDEPVTSYTPEIRRELQEAAARFVAGDTYKLLKQVEDGTFKPDTVQLIAGMGGAMRTQDPALRVSRVLDIAASDAGRVANPDRAATIDSMTPGIRANMPAALRILEDTDSFFNNIEASQSPDANVAAAPPVPNAQPQTPTPPPTSTPEDAPAGTGTEPPEPAQPTPATTTPVDAPVDVPPTMSVEDASEIVEAFLIQAGGAINTRVEEQLANFGPLKMLLGQNSSIPLPNGTADGSFDESSIASLQAVLIALRSPQMMNIQGGDKTWLYSPDVGREIANRFPAFAQQHLSEEQRRLLTPDIVNNVVEAMNTLHAANKLKVPRLNSENRMVPTDVQLSNYVLPGLPPEYLETAKFVIGLLREFVPSVVPMLDNLVHQVTGRRLDQIIPGLNDTPPGTASAAGTPGSAHNQESDLARLYVNALNSTRAENNGQVNPEALERNVMLGLDTMDLVSDDAMQTEAVKAAVRDGLSAANSVLLGIEPTDPRYQGRLLTAANAFDDVTTRSLSSARVSAPPASPAPAADAVASNAPNSVPPVVALMQNRPRVEGGPLIGSEEHRLSVSPVDSDLRYQLVGTPMFKTDGERYVVHYRNNALSARIDELHAECRGRPATDPGVQGRHSEIRGLEIQRDHATIDITDELKRYVENREAPIALRSPNETLAEFEARYETHTADMRARYPNMMSVVDCYKQYQGNIAVFAYNASASYGLGLEHPYMPKVGQSVDMRGHFKDAVGQPAGDETALAMVEVKEDPAVVETYQEKMGAFAANAADVTLDMDDPVIGTVGGLALNRVSVPGLGGRAA